MIGKFYFYKVILKLGCLFEGVICSYLWKCVVFFILKLFYINYY